MSVSVVMATYNGEKYITEQLESICKQLSDGDEVVICDSQGNVILRATAEGLNVAAVYVNGKAVSFPDYTDADEGKTLKIVNGVPAWV